MSNANASPRQTWEQIPETDPAYVHPVEPYAPNQHSSLDVQRSTFDVQATAPSPFTILSATELLTKQIPPRVNILGDGIIVMGQLTSVLGQGGTGKSRYVTQLALSQVLGRDFAGFPTHPEPLTHLLIGTENSIHRQQAELRKMTADLTDPQRETIGRHLYFHTVETMDDNFINIGSSEILNKWKCTLEQIRPDVIYIDPFGETVIGDVNKDIDVRHTLRELTRICKSHNQDATIILVHHARTGRGNIAQAVGYDKGNYGLGSKALYSGVRSQINLAPADPEDSSRIVMSCGKSNDTKPFKARGLKLNEATMTYQPDPTFDVDAWLADVEGVQRGQSASIADAVRAVQAGHTRHGTITQAIIDATGCARATAARRIKEAVESGYLRKRSSGDYIPAKKLPQPQ